MGVYRGRQQSRGISEGFLNGKMGRVSLCGREKKQSVYCTGKGNFSGCKVWRGFLCVGWWTAVAVFLQTLRKGEGFVRNGQRALVKSEEATSKRIPGR